MANTIILKKSSVATKVPAAGDLQVGELAVNLVDQKLYSKNALGTVVLVGQGVGGSGTVTSVTGTSPVSVATGTTTPVISLASGYGDTQNPYASKTANYILAAPNGAAGVPTFRAIVSADIPTLNQSTTGTSANVTGTVAVANGGTGATTAATARTNLGATTVGSNLFTLANPTAITFPRFNADNTVSSLDAATFRTAIGAGTGAGTVTGVTATSPVASSGGTAPAISLSTGYGDTLNPYASKTANFVLAAPNGTAGVPTFRNLTLLDVPDAWTKKAVDCATTAALTINTAQTVIDGVTLSATSRVLVKNQAAPAQNGIYTAVTTTTWVRTPDADTASELAGALVNVDAGTINGGLLYDTDFKSTDVLGTTANTWFRNVDANYFTTVGNNFATLANPTAITFPRINADNTISTLDAATFRTAIGAGTSSTTGTVTGVTGTAPVVSSGGTAPAISMAAASSGVNGYMTGVYATKLDGIATGATANTGTVTSVGGTGTISGLTLTGTVTSSGNLTLGGNLTITADMIYDNFTATASQTTFTTSATYTSGKIEVYVNGVKLRNGSDCTVTSGTSVVMAAGLAVNSLVDLVYPI